MSSPVVPVSDPARPHRRRPAPGVRAVAGGALVTCAMLGVLVAPGDASTAERDYLVTTAAIAPGEPLDVAAVEPVAMSLPPAIARHALTTVDDGDGLSARFAIPAGSLLHTDQFVTGPSAGDPGPEVTVAVPEQRALGGDVAVGDEVDVVATYGSGTEGFSQVIAAGVVVIDVAAVEASLGLDAGLTVTLRLGADDELLPVVHASFADGLSLVHRGQNVDGAEATVFRPGPPESDDGR